MQGDCIQNNLFSLNNDKCVDVNVACSISKNFVNSLQNALNTVDCLEQSFQKSDKYEQRLLQCRREHAHSCGSQWGLEQSNKSFTFNTGSVGQCKINNYLSGTSVNCNKTCRSRKNLTGSCSNTSAESLRSQLEELTKQYKALLSDYDEQCSAVINRDLKLARWRRRVTATHAHLTHLHKVLLVMGEKYLALKRKKKEQRIWYEEQIDMVKQRLRKVTSAAEREQMQFDDHLACYMAAEKNSDTALLLNEVRKCNLLVLENMRLKAMLNDFAPGLN